MADETEDQGSEEALHRGRIQAQGGGTEESVSWARATPPSVSEMLTMCDQLEAKLTAKEKRDREQPLEYLRKHIEQLARYGGISAHPKPHQRPFHKRGSKDIRVDLEVNKGRACISDAPDREKRGD